jgi:hypothetical protein
MIRKKDADQKNRSDGPIRDGGEQRRESCGCGAEARWFYQVAELFLGEDKRNTGA